MHPLPAVNVDEGVELRDASGQVSQEAVLHAGESVRRGDILGDLPPRRPAFVDSKNLAAGTPLRVVRPARAGAMDGSATPTAIAAEDADAVRGERRIRIVTNGDFLADEILLPAGSTLLQVAGALRGRGINLIRPPARPPHAG